MFRNRRGEYSPPVQKGGVRLGWSVVIAIAVTLGAAKLVASASLPPEIVFFAFIASFGAALYLTRRRPKYYHGYGDQDYSAPSRRQRDSHWR